MNEEALRDWWGAYTCPLCLSKIRATFYCQNSWHGVAAVTYECSASSLSPLSLPNAELAAAGVLGDLHVVKYGLVWTAADAPTARVALDAGV